jgi:transposase
LRNYWVAIEKPKARPSAVITKSEPSRRFRIIWLLASGKPTEEVAALTGYSRSWIYELVWGYNRLGVEAMGDKRHQNPGAKTLLNGVQQAQLWQVLQKQPSDGSLWTGPKVFAEYFGLGRNKRVILTIDQAAFHTSGQVRVPEGIHILEMHPKSPELQPAERLWPLANEAIANRTFESLEQLEEVVAYRCRELVKQTDLIRDLTYYHWWPKVGS